MTKPAGRTMQDAPPRDHLAHDLETLVEFLAPFALGTHDNPDGTHRDNESVIWYDEALVTAVIDDVTRADFCSCTALLSMSHDDLALKIKALLEFFKVQDRVRVYHGRFSRAPSPGSP